MRRFRKCKKDDYINTFSKFFNDDNIFTNSGASPHNKLNRLTFHMQRSSDLIFPFTKQSNKQSKMFRKPWMSSGILKSMERRDALFEKWLKTKEPSIRKLYNKCRNRVNRVIKAAQKKYDASLIEKSQSDVKKFWKNVNALIKRKQKAPSSLPSSLKINDTETLNDAQSIANHMNSHFVQKGSILASKLPHSTRNILQSMGQRNPFAPAPR